MKSLTNTGADRVFDVLRGALRSAEVQGARLDLAVPCFSLFAFERLLAKSASLPVRMIEPRSADAPAVADLASDTLGLLGSEYDRTLRNRLHVHYLARQCEEWLSQDAAIRMASGAVPQGIVIVRDALGTPTQSVLGAFDFTTSGLGIAPGNPLSFVQASESAAEAEALAGWFEAQWALLEAQEAAQAGRSQENVSPLGDVPPTASHFRRSLARIAADHAPSHIYARILQTVFGDRDDALDEEQIVKRATGIYDTVVWNKLYSFQRDAAIAAIDKLDRYGGCIIADSVGLGKTFEALAVIKYHELRNDRVLVLCPKRLRDNWTLYAANDRRNILARDRFGYDVLNHTDLSRDTGFSGDIDLANLNLGNYDLVVIDESHNFRNKKTPKQGVETRYDRLMHRIVQEGVRTRVLMLSATPVNNRLADLRNQIAFATEGDDRALEGEGIPSIAATTRHAQRQFNLWTQLPTVSRTTERLVDMLGFDYFALLDKLTIARSRKHIEKYYGTAETGEFPSRLPPINERLAVDASGGFPQIGEVNDEIRRLRLAVYAPLRYVLPHKREAYDQRYSTSVRGGKSIFRQLDREESLINLMRVGMLKRMESSVASFSLTLARQLALIDDLLARMEQVVDAVEEPDVETADFDDPALEALLAGNSVKVLLTDVDIHQWRQDLREDRDRLEVLLACSRDVTPDRDAKLLGLRELLEAKWDAPINPGNRKVIIFTAFADTAEYLYTNLAAWAHERGGVHSAIVTGSRANKTNLPGLRTGMADILTAFAPRAKERPSDLSGEGEIDLLIATDCISEGQNLQDADYLVNYDIHWNPVRIIQRFGRIDRIGSPNEAIQLVNLWPNIELDEYINLEQRVSGRMVLLDVSATGEENVIERDSGDPMNDLDYRRQQLHQMQDAVLDLEDLGSSLSITDLTLTEYRLDLARHLKEEGDEATLPLGAFSVTTTPDADDLPPGTIFCLRAATETALRAAPPGYALAPIFVVHVGEDGAVLLPYTQAKRVLERLRRLCRLRDRPNPETFARFHKTTKKGADMRLYQGHLSAAIASVIGKSEERAAASLFSPGGTHALPAEAAHADDFEVEAFLVILPPLQ